MSGFFSNGLFFSEGHYTDPNDANKGTIKCQKCDEWLLQGYSIEHSQVKDYSDTKKVLEMLIK
jgi:hypothetical protein